MKIPIVDEKDAVIGYKDREDRNLDDIIRITAIWVIDENGNILLQQRKLNKKINPGKWGPAVSGTVEKDETYESNAYKELKEEIGLDNIKLKEEKKFFREIKNSKKFLQLYSCVISRNYKLIPQEEEVEQLKWFTKKELVDEYNKNPEYFVDFIKDLITIFKLK